MIAPEIPTVHASERFEDRLKAKAKALGASAAGIARLEDESAALDARRLRRWLASGFAADLRYMARGAERRADPRLSLPDARSLVALAFDYAFPSHDAHDEARRAASGAALVARYARGRDYHRVLPKRLRRLLEWLQAERPGTRGRAFVDTGPVLERAWAARAGVGWTGKHSLVLRAEGGSWFVLGVLVTDAVLEPDAALEDRCGRCTRCLDACPTGAIVAPYQVDARRCISYLTIERRGAIPIELRPAIGERVFGCDDCQDACPWNAFATDSPIADFRPRGDLLDRPLAGWLDLDEAAFQARFRGTPLLRARREGFLRNVCVALGNRGDADAVPRLAQALAHDPSPLVRAHAAWALGRLGGAQARAALLTAAHDDADETVRAEAEQALGHPERA
ncbi:MAG TPA: tRNA epoxyqueuosine(34) reductase QueG [Candidatus Eisenbacteria bacterium]|nr:tRNA epoxyqueuosine(34) reductase QueG [Candidatus Eisenbacteria bacterium]